MNPPGVLPVLGEEQVWKGLAIMMRNPTRFLPAISSCEVFEDREDRVSLFSSALET